MGLKLAIEKAVADEVAKLPSTTPALSREQTRAALLVKTFAATAAEQSTCPSKTRGGDLGTFPRIGAMVEPFAKTAFELQPYQISNPVETQFGVHLILCTQVTPGRADHLRAGQAVRPGDLRRTPPRRDRQQVSADLEDRDERREVSRDPGNRR